MGSLETLVGSPFIAPQGDDVFNIREPSRNASLDLGSGIAKTNKMQAFTQLQPAKTFVDVPSPPSSAQPARIPLRVCFSKPARHFVPPG
jgi:hypothetical protein